jgi:hypothetical protein
MRTEENEVRFRLAPKRETRGILLYDSSQGPAQKRVDSHGRVYYIPPQKRKRATPNVDES